MGLNIGPQPTPEYAATLRTLLRAPRDIADFIIAEYEAQTGLTATEGDKADALAEVLRATAQRVEGET